MVPPLIVVCGQTASRKSELALSLAQRLDGELICCDSVQIYRGFVIGSAAPGPEDLDLAAHHLYQSLDPTDPGDAARYALLADAAIADVRQRGKRPILVGGTGLYLRAVLEGLAPVPNVPDEVRQSLRREAAQNGIDALWTRLQFVDPEAAAGIQGGPANTQRVLRALEVFEGTGQKLSVLQAQHQPTPRYTSVCLWPQFERAALVARIEARLDRMIARGLLDEVRGLLDAGVPRDCRPMKALGYRQMVEHLIDGVPFARAVELVRVGHRRYARRQATWFRALPEVIRLDGASTTLVEDALAASTSS